LKLNCKCIESKKYVNMLLKKRPTISFVCPAFAQAYNKSDGSFPVCIILLTLMPLVTAYSTFLASARLNTVKEPFPRWKSLSGRHHYSLQQGDKDYKHGETHSLTWNLKHDRSLILPTFPKFNLGQK
jgi:hypothetical protein